MKKLYKKVSRINISIDRINFSLPIKTGNRFESIIRDFKCKNSGLVEANYLKNIYNIYGSKLHTYQKIKNHYGSIQLRLYCNLVKLNDESQHLINEVIDDIIMGITSGDYGVILNQIEVAFDIYPNDSGNVKEIMKFFDQHMVFKYAKIDTYNEIGNTTYAGNKGNVNKSFVGLRMYPKTRDNYNFYRVEFVFNRKFLRDHNITYKNMPIDPYQFNALERIQLLDDITDKGIKNIYRTISKKICSSDSNRKNSKLASFTREKLKTRILGGFRGKKKYVRDQINTIKRLRDKYQFSGTYRNYFPIMNEEFQLLACLSSIALSEKKASKRMCLCQA